MGEEGNERGLKGDPPFAMGGICCKRIFQRPSAAPSAATRALFSAKNRRSSASDSASSSVAVTTTTGRPVSLHRPNKRGPSRPPKVRLLRRSFSRPDIVDNRQEDVAQVLHRRKHYNIPCTVIQYSERAERPSRQSFRYGGSSPFVQGLLPPAHVSSSLRDYPSGEIVLDIARALV